MKTSQIAFWAICVVTLLLGVYFIAKNHKRVTGCSLQDASGSSKQTSKGPVKKCGPCSRTVKYFKGNLKPSVDPCDDFYEFACGNFAKNNPLPGDRSRHGSYDVVGDEVRDILLKSLSSSGPANEIKPLKFARRFFKKLTDKAALEKNDFKGIAALERKLRESKTIEDLVANGKTNMVNLLINFQIIDDPFDPSKKIVSIDQPWFSIGANDLDADEKDVKAKKIREAYKRWIGSSFKLFNSELEDTDAIAKAILDLEIDLAKIITAKEDRRDFRKMCKKFSKKELSNVSPGFDLARIVDGILGKRTVDTVMVEDVSYLKKLSRVLLGREDVIKDLMTWKLITDYGWIVSSKYNEFRFEYLQVANGLKKRPDLRESIMWTLIGEAPNVIGRMYIDAVGFGEEDMQRATRMVDKVKGAMRKMINEKDWMDDATKSKAIEKLDKMKSNIGYPKWIRNDSQLIKSFDIEFDESEGNFELIWKISKFNFNKMIDKMNKPTDTERDWLSSPAVVNAFYSSIYNMIILPAAVLRGGFYNKGCPDSFNYGAIGRTIGHEITHNFDDGGSQFDADGRLANWWSNETMRNFKKAAQKIIDQYGSIVEKRTGLHLNGIDSQGENIADNGGIRASYQAYFGQRVNEKKLSGFEEWTPEKMFFLSYANIWCEVATDQGMRTSVLYDSHAPNKYRVNVPLSNFEAFARAFKCRPGSKMNPKDRVRVW